jgi:hypothetical protein
MSNQVRSDIVILSDQTGPDTPASGQKVVYVKSDGKVYVKDSAGTEAEIGSAVSTAGTYENGLKVGATGSLTTDVIFEVVSTVAAAIPAPKMTTTQRDAIGTPAKGMMIYNTTTNALNHYNGSAWGEISGSGSGGGINYATGTNTDFESGVGDWADFDDGASATPTDLTGGSPTVFSSAQYTTTGDYTPLRETANFRLTHAGAASAQGEGTSLDITIDKMQKGRVNKIGYNYVNSSGYADDELTMWVYDVSNAALIQPAPYKVKSSTVPSEAQFEFQSAIDSSTYRVGFFVEGTATTAWTMDVDNFKVEPNSYQYGSPITDWKTFTPSYTNVSAGASNEGFYRRVGDSIEVQVSTNFATAGAASSIIWKAQTDLGVTIDGAKFSEIGVDVIGGGNWYDDAGGSGSFVGIDVHGADDFRFRRGGGSSNVLQGSDVTSADFVSFTAKIPVTGWSSNVQMSDGGDNRVVAAKYDNQAGQSFNTGVTTIGFNNKQHDSHNAVSSTSGSGWVFTAPISGYYHANMNILFGDQANTSGDFVQVWLRSGQTSTGIFATEDHETAGTVTETIGIGCAGDVYLEAGGTIDAQVSNSTGVTMSCNVNVNRTQISIHRISGPTQIAASETVYVECEHNNALNVSTSTDTIVPYETRIVDTRQAYDLSTGVFTAPSKGRYFIGATFYMDASTDFDEGEFITMDVHINGGLTTTTQLLVDSYEMPASPGNANAPFMNGFCTVDLNQGDTASIVALHQAGVDRSISATQERNRLSIFRIGI